MTVAVLPASFDPITCGHVDIAARAARLFERVVVAVYARPRKDVLFTVEERVDLVRQSLRHLDNVDVCSYDGLTVDLARSVGARVLVRGLRAVSDFEYEFQQAGLNRSMAPDLESICMFANIDQMFLSSTIIKEIAANGGDVSTMVPEPVAHRLMERFPPAAVSGR